MPVVSDLSLMVSDDPWERQSHLSGQGGEDTASSTAGRRKRNVEEVGRLIFIFEKKLFFSRVLCYLKLKMAIKQGNHCFQRWNWCVSKV